MGKAIVLCSDGTGNSTVKDRGTNVFRLYEALDLHGHERDASKPRQVAFYDDGVGTQSNPIARALGGAFGFGLARNVRELYADLCGVWEPGDRIYLFGFSRGAYTVRFLAALIASCGIVRIDASKCGEKSHAELLAAVKHSFGTFRGLFRRFRKTLSKSEVEKRIDRLNEEGQGRGWRFDAAKIEFVGVWDTVDAYGFPWDGLADFWNYAVFPFRFPEFGLAADIGQGCQAIALDDERRSFSPVLWDEREEAPNAGAPSRLEQVWFAGVHSNVGGGYPKQGLALESLCWMIDRAERAGLRFVATETRYFLERRDPADKLYDSRAGAAVYYAYQPRDVAMLSGSRLSAGARPKVHLSVVERIALRADGYAPLGLPKSVEIVQTTPPNAAQQAILGEIEQEIAKAHGVLLSPQVRAAVTGRKWAHRLLVLVTLLAIGWAFVLHGGRDSNLLGALLAPLESLKRLGLHLISTRASPLFASIVGALLVAWVAGFTARRTIERAASQHWYARSARLRGLLARLHAAAPGGAVTPSSGS